MELNEDQITGYKLAINMYNNLLVENKELLMGIIESSYTRGFEEGIQYAQQQLLHQEEQEVSEPSRPSPEKFSDKLKGVRR